jgi:hypothetical protein
MQDGCHESYRHLLPRLREGRISAEIWSRKVRSKISVDPDIKEESSRASAKPKTTKVPVRKVRESVGEKAPLRPPSAKKKEAIQKKKARAQKRKMTDG